MEDLRYEKIRKEIQLEGQSTSSIYAFQGFGRSTELVDKGQKVEELGSQRINILNSIINLEQQLEKEFNESTAQSLSQLNAKAAIYEQDARQRRSDLSLKLSGVGAQADQEFKDRLRNQVASKKRSFKLKKPILLKSSTPQLTKFSKMEGITKLKSISQITGLDKLKSFGSLKLSFA